MAEITRVNKRSSTLSDVVLSLMVIAILGVMIIPIPPSLLDLLLSFNIVFAIVILLVTMYITTPLELSIFPGMLLVATVFRLALNVASTRLILGKAEAGNVIASFGTFVVQDNYVVGFIIFVIIIVIQFVVITKGATRIAEVSARFTLDAMPGKQMAIDADMNAGLIDEQEARDRRELITREADFYGAMDGAAKFVRGDVIAGLIITVINIIGGFIIGMVQHGMTWRQSITTYSMLTVGDGLVTQIPALLLSTAAGLIVTRATSESNLGEDLRIQVTRRPAAIVIAAIVIAFFGIIPGLPTRPFFFLAVAAGVYAAIVIRQQSVAERARIDEETKVAEEVPERIEDYLAIDILSVEIGYGLIPLVDESQGGDFLDRVTTLRRQIAQELGIIIPPVRIRDNIRLGSDEYTIAIRGNEVTQGRLQTGKFLAMNPGTAEEELEGEDTIEPAFGLKAKWITVQVKEQAELAGYTVVEPSSVLATHLSEVIKQHAHEIILRQDVQALIDNVKNDYPVLIDDLIPNVLPLGTLQKVLQHLLKERVPVRDLVTIIETVGDYAATNKDPHALGELARAALYRTVTKMYIDEGGQIKVFTLSPELERMIVDNMQSYAQGVVVNLAPDIIDKILKAVGRLYEQMLSNDQQPIALISTSIRFAFRTLVEVNFLKLAVISYNEVAPEVELFSVGVVKIET